MIKTYKDLINLKDKQSYFIPKIVFRTSKFKLQDLPIPMMDMYNQEIAHNPNYDFYYFDDDDCQSFIESIGNERLLNAYNKLIPTAYKADLWRYSILLKYGGIYIDSTHKALISYDKIVKDYNEIYIKNYYDEDGIYNAFMATYQNSKVLNKVIELSIKNIENEDYGKSNMDIVSCNVLRIAHNIVNGKNELDNIEINKNMWFYEEYCGVMKSWIILNKDYESVIKMWALDDYYQIMYNEKYFINDYPITHYKNLWSNKVVFKNNRWNEIENLYKEILLRKPDLNGLYNYFISNMNIEDIKVSIQKSEEYSKILQSIK